MSDSGADWETPYGTTPGSSTPSPDVSPQLGQLELRTFFWLAIVSTAIIGGAGTVAWLLVH